MQQLNDERLIAYLDGELDMAETAAVADALERDPALGRKARHLAESAALLRSAFDEVLHETVPERLIAAARGAAEQTIDNQAAENQTTENIVAFPVLRTRRAKEFLAHWRSWANVAAAASVASLVVGGSVGYMVGTSPAWNPAGNTQNLSLDTANWLDNVAGYHKLFVAAGANDVGLVDIPADMQSDAARKFTAQLPSDFHLPNLKPWGLTFQGARFLIVEGQPATQLFYTTDNQALGPLTVVVASTSRPDSEPAFDRRGDLNLLYWRHQGHAYALVGSASIGYLWNIHNDLAWQLDAI